jgi:hypothetical protein
MLLANRVRGLWLIMLCALLTGCYLVPGKFDARLDVSRQGDFSFHYKGELKFLATKGSLGPRETPEWRDTDARCFEENGSTSRACNANEIAAQRRVFQATTEQSKREVRELAELFGYHPFDDDANHKLAEQMTKYKGWRSVTYKGEGVFDVDYEINGKLDREVVFPVHPEAKMQMPLFFMRKKRGGTVEIDAPGLIGGTVRKILTGQRAPPGGPEDEIFEAVNGKFMVTTDAKVAATNAMEQTIVNGRTTMRWDILKGRLNAQEDASPSLQLSLKD